MTIGHFPVVLRVTEELKLALLPNPNSPSGTILSESEVAKVAEELECPLVVDEAYADFAKTSCLGLSGRMKMF